MKIIITDCLLSQVFPSSLPLILRQPQLSTIFNPLATKSTVENTVNIALFGDSLVSAYNMADTLVELAEQGGIKLNITSLQFNNAGIHNTYSLYELYEGSDTYQHGDPYNGQLRGLNVIGNGGTSTNSNAKNMWYILSREADAEGYQPKSSLDYFLVFSSRDTSFSSTSNKERNEYALTRLQSIFADYENTANTEFVIMAPPKYADDDYSTTAGSKSTTKIEEYAGDLASAVGNDGYWTIGAAWDYFNKYYSSYGIDLYDRTVEDEGEGNALARHPSQAGAYYNACLIYSMLFGGKTSGMPVYGYLTEDEAKILQNAADAYIASTGVTLSNYTGAKALKEEPILDGAIAEAAEEDNGVFKYLLAAAVAYDARGNWIQYDQRAYNRYVSTNGTLRVYRRDLMEGFTSPEAATPQRNIYTDCSAWITSLYAEVLGYTELRENYNGCNALYQNSRTSSDALYSILVYRWTDDDGDSYINGNDSDGGDTDNKFKLTVNGSTVSNNASRELAKTRFLSTLQPGDLILYTARTDSTGSFSSEGGHVMLYLGNNMVMHCTGDQAGGGGSDYNLNNNSDIRELVGGIKIDHLNIFTEDWSYRYMFDWFENGSVSILRPAKTHSTATENAVARYEDLPGTVAYRTSTAPDGVTVNSGDTVTFYYTVENRTAINGRTYTVTETMPSGVSITSVTGGTYNGNTVTFNLTLAAWETETVECTVKVNGSVNSAILFENASINGVRLTFAQIQVDQTLTAAQQTSVAEKAISLMSGSYADVYALAKAAYSGSGVGYSLESSAATILNAMFSDYSSNVYSTSKGYYKSWSFNNSGGYEVLFEKYKDGSTATNGFYGGQCVIRSSNQQFRVQDIYSENLVAGDIILWVNRSDCYAESSTTAQNITVNTLANSGKIQSCMYIGNDTFIVENASGGFETVSGSEARNLCEQFLGEGLWFLYRPSAQ